MESYERSPFPLRIRNTVTILIVAANNSKRFPKTIDFVEQCIRARQFGELCKEEEAFLIWPRSRLYRQVVRVKKRSAQLNE
jgi:hypothetical protein